MSLKRRNIIAAVLLVLAALGWTLGQSILQTIPDILVMETTAQGETQTGTWATNATMANTACTTYPATDPTAETEATEDAPTAAPSEPASWEALQALQKTYRTKKLAAYLLCFAAAGAAIVTVFLLSQKGPILGPDGALALLALCAWVHYDRLYIFTELYDRYVFALTLAFLLCLRELWGWSRAKCSRNWCAVSRLAGLCPSPQLALTVYGVWISALTGLTLVSTLGNKITTVLLAAVGLSGFLCLWKYGADLRHFQKQLDNFQAGRPIAVGNGAFAETEAQLLTVQAQHEEAVRTAVTSERFKVELISNVSHDLRTPLTAILGYGELLQGESLSPAGREQLLRLNQKAGYMRDLVESLFELTKVSSGVMESKKEDIDLIRLLEQTIGLFDDQLTAAGLTVRRHYCADSLPLTTDGSRMHQVFANLLGNAIKYALPGTRIHLEVKETGGAWVIRMVNTASYEMDFQPEEIMQRFARGDKARSTKGSGLGLAIAQTYTESVGGSFTVAVDGDQFSAIVTLPKTERNL